MSTTLIVGLIIVTKDNKVPKKYMLLFLLVIKRPDSENIVFKLLTQIQIENAQNKLNSSYKIIINEFIWLCIV